MLDKIDAASGPVVVCAEGGAGKSILALHWTRRHAALLIARVAFGDRDQNDILAWRTALNSLRVLAPERIAILIREYRDENISSEELPGLVIHALNELQEPAAILIEDMHLVSERTQARLVDVFRGIPGIRVIVTTRDIVALERDPSMLAAGLQKIGSAELAFTYAETRDLIEDVLGGATPSLVSEVFRATRGHVLATRLAVSRLDHDHRHTTRPVSSRRSLRDTFTAVRQSLPGFSSIEEERFACAAALCPEITHNLSDAISHDVDEPWHVIENFEKSGLGRIERLSGVAAFRFHALVRAALLERRKAVLAPEEAQEIRRAAFASLQDVSDPIDLLELALDANMDESIFIFFARNFSELSLVRSKECLTLLEHLPESRFAADWQLPLMQSVLLVENCAQVPALAHARAQMAIRSLRQTRNLYGPQRILHALGRFAAYRASRQYERAAKDVDTFFRELLAFLPQGELDETTEWSAAALQGMITLALSGDITGAIDAGRLLDHDNHPRRRLHRDSLMSLMHALNGDLRQSAQYLAAIEESRLPINWQDSIISVGSQLAHALQLANRGDVHRAIAILESGLPDLSELELWPAVLWVRARIRLASGDVEYGLLELESSLDVVKRYPASTWWRERLETCRAELLLAVGRPLESQASLQTLRIGPDVAIARANCAFAVGRIIDAKQALRRTCEDNTPVSARISGGLLSAIAALRSGDRAEAALRATSALRLARLAENHLPITCVSAPMLEEIRGVVSNDLWRDPIASPFTFVVDNVGLTKRESAVLARLVRGGTVEEIAAELFVSVNTMKTHLRNLYRKLGVSSRSEAIDAAVRRGLGGSGR
ncbi:helix-turn-helix transcriptional regulator [Microbacterium immunditiarum]|uniref:LuxR family maltose regulon positive regulatory protein n=1 Tax=Microbacterium immunditiarum TaxID=337480 RepID=A0A7Y9GQ51_9MICO|nr:LuxR C-terminal-related transcriptional regulator [Microbacterium immunditiarum]NYE20581.1 LuxR family maltose regulon positive regulatory protein [Microbacterium immunditiarum]